MSNNEAMNRSMQAKLSKHVFPGMLPEAINGMCWPEWDAMVDTFTADYAKHRGCDLQKYATPDELRYINENLTAEARAKLGLKLPEKKLEYTIPTDLSPEKVAFLEASVQKGQCQRFKMDQGENAININCGMLCAAWVNGIAYCGPDKTPSEYLEMFKTILKAQLPPLKYTVPDLNAEEREHVEYLIGLLNTRCQRLHKCKVACHLIIQKILGNDRCPLMTLDSPERAQVIDALKDVLEQQKPLLPPHNVIQFERKWYDLWVQWLAGQPGACPRTYSPIFIACISQSACKDMFPELTRCPCNSYTKEAVRTIIEQCIALGPKFEEYPIWFTDKACTRDQGTTDIVVREDDGRRYFADGTFVFISAEGRTYTKTPPPPKEEFQPYVAVYVDNSSNEARARIVIGPDRVRYPGGSEFAIGLFKYVPFDDPRKCRDMLNEVLGEESMVEEIKVWCRNEMALRSQKRDRYALGLYDSPELLLSFIADLERKAKCKE